MSMTFYSSPLYSNPVDFNFITGTPHLEPVTHCGFGDYIAPIPGYTWDGGPIITACTQKNFMEYRVKTEEELIKEFGPHWKNFIKIRWGSPQMDYLFGQTFTPKYGFSFGMPSRWVGLIL